MIEASRFVFRQDFVREDGSVRKEAFLPPGRPRPFESSVIVHTGLPIDWKVGQKIGAGRKKPMALFGSAEFNDGDAVAAGLEIDFCPSPVSPNHANLRGWSETDELDRLDQADVIASRALFVAVVESA